MSFGMAVPMITSGLGSLVNGTRGLGKNIKTLVSSSMLANTAVGFGSSKGYLAALSAGGAEAGATFAGGVGLKGGLKGLRD